MEKTLIQGKNDYKDDGIFYGLSLAPEINYCLTIGNFKVVKEHKHFKKFTILSETLDRKKDFKMLNGDKLITKVPLRWKHCFYSGVVTPHKQKY